MPIRTSLVPAPVLALPALLGAVLRPARALAVSVRAPLAVFDNRMSMGMHTFAAGKQPPLRLTTFQVSHFPNNAQRPL